jgi:hypothetical protein
MGIYNFQKSDFIPIKGYFTRRNRITRLEEKEYLNKVVRFEYPPIILTNPLDVLTMGLVISYNLGLFLGGALAITKGLEEILS